MWPQVGTLLPGAHADMAVLTADPRRIGEEKHRTHGLDDDGDKSSKAERGSRRAAPPPPPLPRVVRTYVDGECAYGCGG